MSASLRLQLFMVATTIVSFLVALGLNLWLLPHVEYLPGIGWIYLPAGVRLLCTLLFAEAGAIGLLLVSLGLNFGWYFPDDPGRAFAGAVAATAGPYLVYRGAQRLWGLHTSLASLTPARLLVLSAVCAMASPLLHHLFFALRGEPAVLQGFLVMFVGDVLGTLGDPDPAHGPSERRADGSTPVTAAASGGWALTPAAAVAGAARPRRRCRCGRNRSGGSRRRSGRS